jgi:hypothetical protein
MPIRLPGRSNRAKFGTVKVIFRSGLNREPVFLSLVMEGDFKAAQSELRKHFFPNQRGGGAQNNTKMVRFGLTVYSPMPPERPVLSKRAIVPLDLDLAAIARLELTNVRQHEYEPFDDK